MSARSRKAQDSYIDNPVGYAHAHPSQSGGAAATARRFSLGQALFYSYNRQQDDKKRTCIYRYCVMCRGGISIREASQGPSHCKGAVYIVTGLFKEERRDVRLDANVEKVKTAVSLSAPRLLYLGGAAVSSWHDGQAVCLHRHFFAFFA